MTRRFGFVGVSTGASSIMRIFPRWRDVLGLGEDVEIVGRDIALDAPPEDFRAAVCWLRDTPGMLGGLVTTHKIGVLEHGRDLFDDLDAHAQQLGEVSCVCVRDGRVSGWAKDPITAARALDALLPAAHFVSTGGAALIMGAGGAGSAIAHCLRERADAPDHVVLTDRDPARLRAASAALDAGVQTHVVAGPHDELLRALPPGSLVVNATGMGKDRPGSPLADEQCLPSGAIAWELNYRGELAFLHQAHAAIDVALVEDGWRYFVEGWTAVIEEVFERPIARAEIPALMAAAEFARPPLT